MIIFFDKIKIFHLIREVHFEPKYNIKILRYLYK